ncbi:MAG: 4Fe-4S binding protein [Magnetococcales bacterium]|nr:4Fe-4S binding protein [Magnetococcales bacterium]
MTTTICGQDIAIIDAQCTKCGRCIDICPQDVFYFCVGKQISIFKYTSCLSIKS